MSWDSKLIDRAKEIIELYPQKRSALGPLLYLAQEKEGYIDDDSVVEISKLIGITEVQVRSVASFYTCLLYTSPSPRDRTRSRMPSSA